jgi:O-antigen/teichoic acid export membrane protein
VLTQAPTETHRVARGGVQVVVARAAFYGLAYFAILMLARGLGPVQYGIYGLVISVVGWIEQVAQSTLAPAAAKLIPEGDPDGHVARTTLLLSCSLFTALFVATWLAAPLIDHWLGLDDSGFLLRVGALDLLVFGAYVASRGIVQGHRRFLPLALSECAYAGTKVLGLVSLLALGFSVVGALVVHTAATIGGLALLLPHVVPLVRGWNFGATRGLLPLALRFGCYMLALQTLSGLDLWMLRLIGNDGEGAQFGVYVAARAAAVVPSLILVAVSEVLLPSLSKALADGDRQLARQYLESSVRFIWMFVVPITALVFLSGDELMALLFSDAYTSGGLHVGLLAAGSGLFALVALFGAALNASGWSGVATLALLAVGPVGVLLNAVLVPSHGAAGAATAQLLTAFAAASALGVAAFRRFGPFFRTRTLFVVAAATLVMAAAAAPVTASGVLLPVYFALGLTLYVGLLVAMGEIRARHLAAVWDGLGLRALTRVG